MERTYVEMLNRALLFGMALGVVGVIVYGVIV